MQVDTDLEEEKMAEQAKLLLAAYLAVGPDEMKRARAIDNLKAVLIRVLLRLILMRFL